VFQKWLNFPFKSLVTTTLTYIVVFVLSTVVTVAANKPTTCTFTTASCILKYFCCIRCGPDEERILDVVPREDRARWLRRGVGQAAHTLNNPQAEYIGVLLCKSIE
jgi:hypothetical protein